MNAANTNISVQYFLDIALIRIDKPFSNRNIKALRIDDLWKKGINSNSLRGENVVISGWGTTETGTISKTLKKQTVKVQDVSKAKLFLSHRIGYGSDRGDSGGMVLLS